MIGLEFARKVADRTKCLLMAENVYLPNSLKYLKKGGILTYLYIYPSNRIGQGIVDKEMEILPEFLDSVKRGIVLDVGHGKGSFSWKVAESVISEGIKPNTISTDLWTGNVNGPVYDMPITMSKFLLLVVFRRNSYGFDNKACTNYRKIW